MGVNKLLKVRYIIEDKQKGGCITKIDIRV